MKKIILSTFVAAAVLSVGTTFAQSTTPVTKATGNAISSAPAPLPKAAPADSKAPKTTAVNKKESAKAAEPTKKSVAAPAPASK